MKVSIVIPVYNEADSLRACLEAVATQSVQPLETIVVDNNSTDETAAVAEAFDFVTLLREPRQGVVHARSRGFNAAQGNVIARIDADTIPPKDWVVQVINIFKDATVSAVSGAPHYYDFPLANLADAIDKPLRAYLAKSMKINFLWGANMAVRRSAWQQVRQSLCRANNMHEDFDLGIHLQRHGLCVSYDERLIANVSSRRIDTGFLSYVRYTLASPRTYARHGLRTRFHMYPVLAVCWFFYLPGRLLYRSYNPQTNSYSLAQLVASGSERVDPTANIV